MNANRKIEIFSAGSAVCEAAIARLNDIACPSCEVTTLDMDASGIAERAGALGIRSLPAVVIDGKLADCCTNQGVDEDALRAAGLGQPLS